MGIILALVSFLLSLLVYVRMVRREIPEPLWNIIQAASLVR